MKSLKVALLQLRPEESIEENLQKGLSACRQAREMGADLALFPEMWSVGYRIPEDITELKKTAVTIDSYYIRAYQELAKELNMAVAVTLLEAWEPLPRNTMVLIDRYGHNILTYAKVHTCDFGEECRLTPGDGFYVAD